MARFGYALSSEEHPGDALVRNARLAEDAGFDFAMVSDHYHPWTNRPPIYVGAAGRKTAELAGRIGDGLVSVAPEQQTVEQFESAGGAGKPRIGKVEVCFADDEGQALRTAHEWWPQTVLSGDFPLSLPMPAHFEQAVRTVREEDVAERVTCGPDPDRHASAVQRFVEAGYDHVYIHQVGPEQERFVDFYAHEVLPRLRQAVPV